MYPRDWKEQLLNAWWNTDRWELHDRRGVLAGAGAVEKEEVGMGGGNGSLAMEVAWARHGLCCCFAPQLYKSILQTKPDSVLYGLLTRQLLTFSCSYNFSVLIQLMLLDYKRWLPQEGSWQAWSFKLQLYWLERKSPPTLGAVPRFWPVQRCVVPQASSPLSFEEVLCQYPSVPEVWAAPSLHGCG